MSGLEMGVAASLIAAGLVEEGRAIRETLSEASQEATFSTELDAIETDFTGALQDNIADIESRCDTEALTEAVEQWSPVVRELYGLEEAAEVDGVDRILFTSEAEAVEDAVERVDDNEVLIRLTADAVHHIWQETARLGNSDAFERVVSAAERLAESDPERFERVASGVEQRLDEEHLNAVAGLEWDERLDY
jgi:hypothetical protein